MSETARGQVRPWPCARLVRGMMERSEENPETTAAPQTRSDRRGYGKWLLIALALAVLLYGISPYYAFWRFTVALRTGDRNQLERMVDFGSLRKSLKEQLRAKIAPPRREPGDRKNEGIFGSLSAGFGPRLIDTLVEAYVTPEGLAAFLVNPKVPTQAGAAPAGAAPAQPEQTSAAPPSSADEVPSTEPGFRSIDWSSVRYAFFTGPADFAVDLDGTKLHFRLDDLRWQLRAVELDISEIKL